MIRRLLCNQWWYAGFSILFFLTLAVFALHEYGPAALEALSGSVPEPAKKEPMYIIYGVSILGLSFLAIAIAILLHNLKNPVKKGVQRYLEKNPTVTMEQLDGDFAAAEKIEDIWVGKRWTFNARLSDCVLDNDRIVWVFVASQREGRGSYSNYVGFGLLDGTIDTAYISAKNISKVYEMYGRFPHIIVGNGPNYEYLFKNDREAFLNMKGRQKE